MNGKRIKENVRRPWRALRIWTLDKNCAPHGVGYGVLAQLHPVGLYKRKVMKRILFFAVMMMATLFMGCASFLDWGKRINLTVGGGGTLNDGDISVENMYSTLFLNFY
jgi:hypothetical protein